MHPVELAEWLRTHMVTSRVVPSITSLMGDHTSRFGREPTYDHVYSWIFMRLLEEVRSLPASPGRDWILGEWQARMWPRFLDALVSSRTPFERRPTEYLAWNLAAEVERVCHPRVTPQGFLHWLRGEGADVELHHAWARCAEGNPDFIKASWDEDIELRIVREVFIARITQGVRCLSPFYLPTIVRWLAFLQAPTTAEEAFRVARMQSDEQSIFVSFRLPLMAAWVADQLEALMEAPSDGCVDGPEKGGSSGADGSA